MFWKLRIHFMVMLFSIKRLTPRWAMSIVFLNSGQLSNLPRNPSNGRVGIYIYRYRPNGVFLKVGLAGANSGRFGNVQHNGTAPGTIGLHLQNHQEFCQRFNLRTNAQVKDFIIENFDRVNILMDAQHRYTMLEDLEVFAQACLWPVYEGERTPRRWF